MSQGAPPIEDVLVVSGQDLYNIDFREVLGLHGLRGADVTVVTRRHRHDEDNEMGFCTLGSDHKHVETFVEKPSPRKMFDRITSNTRDVEVSLGMYVFKRSMRNRCWRTT
jgi:glucose-1-phosphate adenylyltransferase